MSQTDTSLLGRLIKGAGANAYGQAVVIIIQLVGVPILLRHWGAQLYGEWLILAAIPSYLSMVDLGFSLSAANDMTGRVARGDRVGMLAVFQSLFVLVMGIIFVGLLASALLILIFPIGLWMNITTISVPDTRWILWLLAVGVLIQLADGVNHAGFRSHGEYAYHSFFSYTTLFLQQLALWITALSGYGPVVAAFCMLAVRIVGTFFMAFKLFQRHETLKPGYKYASYNLLRTLLKPALANIAMPLAQGLNIQGLILVIGATLGPLAVVTFSTLRTLTRFALQMVLSISHTFEPELAAAWGKNDRELLLKLYINNLRLSLWLSLGAVISLSFLGNWIVSLWTHGEISLDMMLYTWLLISALASVLWYGGLNLLKAANRHLSAAILYVFGSLVAIMLAAIFVQTRGRLSDTGLALLVMDAMMTAFVFRFSARSIGCSSSKILLSMLDLSAFKNLFQFLIAKVHNRAFENKQEHQGF